MKSVMSHSFSNLPKANIPRSAFDRSHGHKTTFDGGYLIPVFCDEAYPGDTMKMNMTCFGRLSTPVTPVMDNMYLDSFFFAVPIRLLWTNWKKFNGEQVDPGDSTDFTIPQIVMPNSTGCAVGSLSDYLGIPPTVSNLSVSTLWHRAYNAVWNDWFRSQDLQDSVVVDTDDGPDTYTDYSLLRRCKRRDYFTSCLPWPQKGDTVELPLGTSAPVYGIDTAASSTTREIFVESASGTTTSKLGFRTSGSNQPITMEGSCTDLGPIKWPTDQNATGYNFADLSSATAASVNAVRQAFQIQKLYERDARGGTRYPEMILSHFGVTNPDMRMQRPEYLGGGSCRININPVSQTSSTDGTSPQGHLTAYGTFSGGGHSFTKSFTEHCVLIGMVSVRADLTYQQGLNRMFSRSTRWDYYWPSLAHIGEQSVLNKEIYAVGPDGSPDPGDDDVFGYQERYAELRYKPSLISGAFRSVHSPSLDNWHLSQEFGSLPTLNASFIQDNPPISRVVADATEPEFIFDSYFDYKCIRPMPTYSVPGLIDHF